MKIVIDMYGGDGGAAETVTGAALASLNADYKIVIAGVEEEARGILKTRKYDPSVIEFLNAKGAPVTNDDIPTDAIKTKSDSSMFAGLRRLRDDPECAGMISAGSTGALLAGGLFIAGRIAGVHRPALAVSLPTHNENKRVLLLDCGANADCKPEFLLQFALMGGCYMSAMYGIKSPSVALLSNGSEDKKGSDANKEAFALLRSGGLNFVGNREARDILSGDYDVFAADGFTGNVALKSLECSQLAIFAALKQEIKKRMPAMIGYGLMKGAFKGLAKRMDYTKQGGAILLGCKKIVMKTHGSSKAHTVAICADQVASLAKNKLIEKISDKLK
ncbi:MAG: phosphate acyltransferase PlsX [Firmicutes bacterium]|nr:phosphate acyltransferase PlsX [Bacillota bacterium]